MSESNQMCYYNDVVHAYQNHENYSNIINIGLLDPDHEHDDITCKEEGEQMHLDILDMLTNKDIYPIQDFAIGLATQYNQERVKEWFEKNQDPEVYL